MRKQICLMVVVAAFGALALAGCANSATNPPAKEGNAKPAPAAGSKEAKIEAALAKLPAVDRKLAEAQKWCAVQTKSRLGAMDTPIKLMVNEQPVFLCCESCEERARANPEKTLAKVEELKKAAAEGK